MSSRCDAVDTDHLLSTHIANLCYGSLQPGMERPSAAEQRATAVAKLKRAASLPRMQNGRRPPMHADAVSEGEKGGADISSSNPTPSPPDINNVAPPVQQSDPPVSLPMALEPVELQPSAPSSVAPQCEEVQHSKQTGIEPPSRVTSPEKNTRAKRRSRSRSRSRASKDLKAKARAAQTPTPLNGNDSSPEEASDVNAPAAPPLISPIPSRPIPPQQRSPMFPPPSLTPEPYGFFPSSPSPLPSLDAIAANSTLMRSNSARMMAMAKLTGEPLDASMHPLPSPSPKLVRNNTVAGGERVVARRNMLRMIAERTKDMATESASEDAQVPSPKPKRRRRSRSKRASTNTPLAIEESDYIPTSAPDTPLRAPSTLPPTPAPVDQQRPSPTLRSGETLPFISSSFPDQTKQESRSEPGHAQPRKRRSVLVEEEDPEEQLPIVSVIQPSNHSAHHRTASLVSEMSQEQTHTLEAFYVPVAQRAPSGDQFPSNPFGTPLQERPTRDDEEEEKVIYQPEIRSRAQTPFQDAYGREISWVAEPLEETHTTAEDEEEDEEEEDDDEEEDTKFARQYTETLQIQTTQLDQRDERSADLSDNPFVVPQSPDSEAPRSPIVETETSPEEIHAPIPPSPSIVAAISQTISPLLNEDTSTMSQQYPIRLSVGTPSATVLREWDETSNSAKRDISASAWERVKGTFSRSGSRSRGNSVVGRDRRDNTDSSISRESAASLGSTKAESGLGSPPAVSQQQNVYQHISQSPSASTSVASLAPAVQMRSAPSPIPPASLADREKYNNAKLFPFPGIKQLEEQRNRTRGLSISASTPILPLGSNYDTDTLGHQTGSSLNTPAHSPQLGKELKLSHQASDTRLLEKYSQHGGSGSSSVPITPPTVNKESYFDARHLQLLRPLPTASPVASKLPTNREGVKKWLSVNKIFSSSQTPPTSPDSQKAYKKPSLSELFRGGRKEDFLGEFDDTGAGQKSVKPAVDHIANGTFRFGTPLSVNGASQQSSTSDLEKTPKVKRLPPAALGQSGLPPVSPPFSSPSEYPSSTTPDPMSSLDELPTDSTSGSSSTTSSHYSADTRQNVVSPQGSVVLQRLDEMLGRNARSPMWNAAVDDPPRKLVLQSSVLQVANANTVKDRYLFLFTDILVIAKPIANEYETLLETSRGDPTNRTYVVKNVVMLNKSRITAERDETSSISNVPRHPLMKTFVQQFAKDPDSSIGSLFGQLGRNEDPIALGQLMFKTLDLDRSALGEYLSRRSSRLVLKAYLDGFGFRGLRIDKALRVFLLSINIPPGQPSVLDIVLDAFAGRWYEANAGSIAYDKDMAIRLARSVAQLNEVLHGPISQTPGPTGYPRRNVSSKDFVTAFRRHDVTNLITDNLLEDIYYAVRSERLMQARKLSADSVPDIPVVIKRPLPLRLTYKVQSEPIVLRIPRPDPEFKIRLYGQNLTFDPPEISFTKSAEVSFRITGMALGAKTVIMARSGANGSMYTGLPLSNTLVVERAFMRNTFQLAFIDHNGKNKRYMFSLDDALKCHQWTTSVKRQIDLMSSALPPPPSTSQASRFHRAAEKLAFRVLQDTLLGLPDPVGSRDMSKAPVSLYLQSSLDHYGDKAIMTHSRSKSRSALYQEESDDVGLASSKTVELGDAPLRGRVWSGPALEMQCQQNSSIALVLSYLQVGAPDVRDSNMS